ncbi:MAG: helix-turn-helix transcriptional regulator [Clostridia bacterium]|nr:helix-turn-helix transcriptional regulator [Clostridia bacterium]
MIDQKKLLSDKLKAFRQANNLSQYEFAEDCGMSSKTVSLIERCKLNTTLDTLDLLAVRMDTTVSELLKSTEDCSFILISTEITVEEKSSVTYGIGVVKDNELIKEFRDISLDYNKVKRMVNTFNFHRVAEYEFEELAEDFCD